MPETCVNDIFIALENHQVFKLSN